MKKRGFVLGRVVLLLLAVVTLAGCAKKGIGDEKVRPNAADYAKAENWVPATLWQRMRNELAYTPHDHLHRQYRYRRRSKFCGHQDHSSFS